MSGLGGSVVGGGGGGAGAGSKTEWPQSLKEFANRAFNAATDGNRKAVQEELRTLIYQCYTEGTISTTDWSTVELQSLSGSGGKKKKKRTAATTFGESSSELLAEQEKKEKRARRFDRDRAAYDRQEREGAHATFPVSSSTSSLADRLGGVKPLMNLQQSHAQTQGWTYDFTGNRGEARSRDFGPYGGAYNAAHTNGGGPAHARLVNGMSAAVFADHDVADPNVIDWDQDTVVGLSTKLEKPYLRLTSAPDPRNVRTLATLMQTLEFLKKKWRTEANYGYICDQFKSMRQDLTVQRIKNDFTVKVYEIHARIALEKGDLGEYNQCQSQLRGLYALGLHGAVMEFLAYRILYLLHTRNRREVNTLMAELTPAAKAETAVKHALAVRSALATSNFHAFFRLYDDAPNMNSYIIDHFIDRERINALVVMSRCFRPSLSLSFISTELAFTDLRETHEFLSKYHAAVYAAPSAAAAAAAAAPTLSTTGATGKKSTNKAPIDLLPPLEQRNWDAKIGAAVFGSSTTKITLSRHQRANLNVERSVCIYRNIPRGSLQVHVFPFR